MKPKVKLTGKDGNVFNLIGICSNALKKAKQYDAAKKMVDRCSKAGSYHEAIGIMGDYCEIS